MPHGQRARLILHVHATSFLPNNLLFFRLSYLFLFTKTVSKGNVNNQDRRKRCLFNVVSQWLVYSKTQPISICWGPWSQSSVRPVGSCHASRHQAVLMEGKKEQEGMGRGSLCVCVWRARGRETEKRETYWIAEAALTRLNSLWSIKGLCINSKTTPDSY